MNRIAKADEPTSGLDPLAATQILDLIIRARDLHRTSSLLVTKRLDQVPYLSTSRAVTENNVKQVVPATADVELKKTQVMLLGKGEMPFLGSYADFASSMLPAVTHLIHPEPGVHAASHYVADPWGRKSKLR